jgi:para-aminobenzoate synthetase/4-amino-4-deoxychorismate lyase
VILWNERKELTETTTANIVLRLNGELLTPPVGSGLLAGTYRDTLLAEGKIAEKVISLEDLGRADAIFVINSVRKWREAEILS